MFNNMKDNNNLNSKNGKQIHSNIKMHIYNFFK